MVPRLLKSVNYFSLEDFENDSLPEDDAYNSEIEYSDNPDMYILCFIRGTEMKLLRDEEKFDAPILAEANNQLMRLKSIYFTSNFKRLMINILDHNYEKTERDEESIQMVLSYMENLEDLISGDNF